MKFKLYTAFAFVAIATGIVTLGRLLLGQDPQEVVPVNIIMASLCVTGMAILMYKERRKIERRN